MGEAVATASECECVKRGGCVEGAGEGVREVVNTRWSRGERVYSDWDPRRSAGTPPHRVSRMWTNRELSRREIICYIIYNFYLYVYRKNYISALIFPIPVII